MFTNEYCNKNIFKTVMEKGMFATRYFIVLAVIFGLFSSSILFILASLEIIDLTICIFNKFFYDLQCSNEHVLGTIITSVDLYLVGIVLLIFSFGIYELFISRLDLHKDQPLLNSLEIRGLDDLKTKISKIIIIILIVTFFKRVIEMKFQTPIEILCFSLSICILCVGLFMLNKTSARPESKKWRSAVIQESPVPNNSPQDQMFHFKM